MLKSNHPIKTLPLHFLQALHNRKFREYCTHFVDKDLNALVKSLMLELMRFQDKIYFKEKESMVNMFKQKRRFFNGLREVLKYVKLRKLKVRLRLPLVCLHFTFPALSYL